MCAQQVLLLRNKGIRVVNSPTRRGHQHVKLKVQIPKSVTPRQKELLEEFANPAVQKTDKTGKSTAGKCVHCT